MATRTSQQWRDLAVSIFEIAEDVEATVPGSLVATELYAKATAAAAIATALSAKQPAGRAK